eukprot:m.120016 g.120016  ORF g.120016 m.120016 type:complete len:67 (+) comp37719_c0_seq2:713-913(+)
MAELFQMLSSCFGRSSAKECVFFRLDECSRGNWQLRCVASSFTPKYELDEGGGSFAVQSQDNFELN